jgi:hypothetical protein
MEEGKMRHSGNGKVGSGWTMSVEGAAGSVEEEVAYARARFAVDPSTPSRLSSAWIAPTGTMEEDESELIDAVADCLSVGLPLDAAVASWRSGSLQVSDEPQGDDADEDDDTDVYGEDDDTGVYDPPHTGRRRIVQT